MDQLSGAPRPSDVLDLAFAGAECEIVSADGRRTSLPVERWTTSASAEDHALFVDHCHGPTLDVGCGPGRLVEALLAKGLDVLGVDISAEAVRRTTARGVTAVRADVFDLVPSRSWSHALLADGNVGIGGDPARLLRAVAKQLAPGGTLLVEVAARGAVAVHEGVHLRAGALRSSTFSWATVGVAAAADLAASAGMTVREVLSAGERRVAVLAHVGSAHPSR